MTDVYEFKDGKSFYKGSPIFSVDEELSDGMSSRLDEMNNITLEYIEKLFGEKLDRSEPGVTEIIGSVLETTVSTMISNNHAICFPYIDIANEDPRCNLLCIHHSDCPLIRENKCPHKEDIYTYEIEEYKEE